MEKTIILTVIFLCCTLTAPVFCTENRSNNANNTVATVDSTGILSYGFDYKITDLSLLDYLQTNELIIKKGTYKPDYSSNPLGDIILILAKPISERNIENNSKVILFSGYRCNTNCEREGNSCFTCKIKYNELAFYFEFTVELIFENGVATKLKISNKAISQNGQPAKVGKTTHDTPLEVIRVIR